MYQLGLAGQNVQIQQFMKNLDDGDGKDGTKLSGKLFYLMELK